MKESYLGLSAIGWERMMGSWWNKVIASFLLASVVLGSLYLLYRSFLSVKRYWLSRKQQVTVPAAVARYLNRLRSSVRPLSIQKESTSELKSFGVYLGNFSSPPTPAQARLLTQWDVVVLNPLEQGVVNVLNSHKSTSVHTLGRLNVRSLAESESSTSSDEIIRSLGLVVDAITKHFKSSQDAYSPFTGVLLANFSEHFQGPILNELVRYISALGLGVWLEMSPPVYLTERQALDINMKSIQGIVYRNATTRSDGDRQNFHQMEAMRTVQRAVAAQRVPHGPPVMTWETIDDGVEHQYAVTQRSFNWARFNSALPWIGTTSALVDADIAAAQTVTEQPLGALMWLKGDKNMKAHNIWRENDVITASTGENAHLFDSLHSFIPDLNSKLRFLPGSANRSSTGKAKADQPPRYSQALKDTQTNPLSTSAQGDDFTGLGCFQLGIDVTADAFAELLQAQRNLRDLDLLNPVKPEELQEIRQKLEVLVEGQSSRALSPSANSAVHELLNLLSAEDETYGPRLQVFIGLHSGFQTGSDVQFWGLYDVDASSGGLNIYLSGFASDRASAILHTFLSSRGCTRTECFMGEVALAEQSGTASKKWLLPERIVNDLQKLSPTEAILLRRRLTVKSDDDSFLLTRIRDCCEYQLIDVPSLAQLRALNSTAYLRGDLSPEDLVESRLTWLHEKGFWHPNPAVATQLFREVDSRLHEILMNGESETYEQLGTTLQAICQAEHIDAGADLFALAVFCAFRKLALDEIYLEVMDRNAFPNHATDQAACFAENFAVGSRCDSFFDITPRVLGKIISDRYRAYYMKYQPPSREDGYTELPTAYAAMQIDSDPEYGTEEVSSVYKVTFLGIFAVPALIDIMLLTTIGRGLYLTTFMTSMQKTMATTALMLALLVCGAVGSWISSGGCYYIYASAFPAMNMFVLTRFVAGVALILLGGSLSLLVAGITQGILNALVFVFYFAMLSTYLLTLSALSIYQVPGSSFQSGRSVIMACIPILFISPVLTIWVQHDIAVYVCVLTTFLASLLFGARKIMSQWATWYLNIPVVTDAEVVSWYAKQRGISESGDGLKGLGATGLPRKELHAAVVKDANRAFWTRASKDPLVSRLSGGYESTKFLMSWYCRHRRTAMPLAYSPTWNLTLKAGLENITNMQKGLKLHSAFLHWRHTGADVWSGILYFVVALLDKWAALVSGGALVGLSAAGSEEFRLAVGFGLCYYLIGAVSLDAVSQPLWTAANENTIQPITSVKFLRQATKNDRKARRILYWTNLAKFFFLHIWGIAITSALMWTFNTSKNATILYLAYLGAYTGLLWYQYNKIYCGMKGAQCLAWASILGLPVGIALHKTLPMWTYSGVVALSFGTWVAAIHSMFLSDIGLPIFWKSRSVDVSESTEKDTKVATSYSCSALEPYPQLSQATLAKAFENLGDLDAEQRFTLNPSKHPGARVVDHLVPQSRSAKSYLIEAAFPTASQLIQKTIELWNNGQTVVELVGARHFPQLDQKLGTITQMKGNRLHIYVALGKDLVNDAWTMNIQRNAKIIAEALIQASCEHHFGLSHDHAMLSSLLVVEEAEFETFNLPEGIKRQIESSAPERLRVVSNGNVTMLKYLLLGVDCEREWDDLPSTIRAFLLKRCAGQYQPLGPDEEQWIQSRVSPKDRIGADEFVARFNLGATLAASVDAYAKAFGLPNGPYEEEVDAQSINSDYQRLITPTTPDTPATKRFIQRSRQIFNACIKFLILALVADPEYQRELDYMLRDQAWIIHWPITFFLNGIWSFCKFLQGIIIPTVLFHRRKNVAQLQSNMKGMKTILKSNRVIIESLKGPSTCFWTAQSDGSIRLAQYNGRHDSEPAESKQLVAVNTYAERFRLRQREEYRGEKLINMFTYEYPENNKRSKLPIQRQCVKGDLHGQIVQYDERGYITTGSTFRSSDPVQFTYWYRRSAKFDDELLRGEYVLPHMTIRIMWSMPPRDHPERLDDWVPFTKVTEATFIQGPDVYHASWAYEHKFHPEITTTLNGNTIDTPPMIKDDWFHVLQKPERCSFVSDNPVLAFSSVKSNFFTRLLRLNVKRYPISTSHARTQLWKLWKNGRDLDAITARWIDEDLVRSDSILKSYWRNRDLGLLSRAKAYLDAHSDTIMARTDVDPEISAWLHIAYKIADYYSFGQGGDSTINTRTLSGQMQDSDDELHILAMDTSTWPNEPGGVSACRRDMVNDLKTIKWSVVAETANDYGVPRFQIERNVKSLTVLPLWGLDFLNPTHGVLRNTLDSEIVERTHDTSIEDIKKNFIPILTSLVTCARALHPTREIIEEATKALVDLNTYFEGPRNYNVVWNSDIVKSVWRELWLTEDQEDTLKVSEWWDYEKPTMQQLDQALNMWHRYLFIFSIPVPEKIPDVFQASHHFTGATYGILCKVKRNVTLHVWDHCISFREFTTFMSSAVSFDMPFVNSSLMSLGHLSCVLLEHHADVVLPCAAYFNPGWEVELGTAEGALEHRKTFARKIDPVVNGICNMEKFEPIKKIKTDTPTVVMLSHIQFVKDIKNAIMATDLIVNKWGFSDYQLHIYGDMERAAGHSTECQELIASKGLQDHCILKGLGNASLVLQDAWVFLNSSISEGLPLAMGEAALTGVPVVCTDVGASFCVVTDGKTGDQFSEVVPPNDSESLARAQINILALLGRWAVHAEDAPGVEAPILSYPNPSPEEVKQISDRMYEKKEHRRKLGMMGRDNVLNNFSADRYLREHEQMLWIGKYRSPVYRARNSNILPSNSSSFWFGKEKMTFGATVDAMSTPPRTPRLAPERWSSAPSSRASSIRWFKEKPSTPW
ncbi:glycosyltransferase family 4 protein [Aaosphaeria arxii CBS 175.79]|uniref:Glycosyltransferase family 4 protein n=1 Tax=Aaosphaeria arxii CBS 175.79 TaxID=1450172 RepID=A0A6A5XWZ5_9PLEO|nr:glycosyltransferase family 4 protein [Aaosphaeria arxii CBS 175.79]KAF2017682.1 glycosyltransferase family 4 protein [Aaosphaeria arxii CBS 175.79]